MRHLTEVLVAWGPAGILLLSILDSSGVPVAGVFDAFLILIAVKNPSIAWLCAGMAVIGSTIGSTVLFSAARNGSGRFAKKPEADSRAARFRRWFRRYGMVTVFVPALMPIPMPLKLFVISAGVLGTSWREFISVLVTARILRYFGEAWLGMQLGAESTTFLKDHVLYFVFGAAVLALMLAGFIRLRGASGDPEAVM
ncbi:MAG TPA: VTT domain-containing protein [Bryobacteraceae bacterium]|nr:VTT domain-containing protein [Bryobacteraceae bacterium]